MSPDTSPSPVSTHRESARRLLKDLRSGSPETAASAATRFLGLRSFAGEVVATLLDGRDRVRLKHALAVIAALTAIRFLRRSPGDKGYSSKMQ